MRDKSLMNLQWSRIYVRLRVGYLYVLRNSTFVPYWEWALFIKRIVVSWEFSIDKLFKKLCEIVLTEKYNKN